ncbi:MAG: hypothetical protein KDA62_08405 [Planctomycetales bacterium]|nr:hypothetical protein [Planctomycetales bacterium]
MRLFPLAVGLAIVGSVMIHTGTVRAGLWAGVAKEDITNREAGPVNDPLWVKALVLKDERTAVAIVTVDAVAIAEIGSIRNEFLGNVRQALQTDIGLEPANLVVNASHCHGTVAPDVEARTIAAVKAAWSNLTPVTVGVGVGSEDRVSTNRRLKLKNGREADVRHAYSLPPDEEIEAVGPIDPEIGLLRLDREDGRTLAIVYNFACHPIQGVPGGGNTADMIGFASRVIEDSFGDGAMAFFVQGCAGDINPVFYKDVAHPRDAETLGNLLGLSAMRAAKQIDCEPTDGVTFLNETLELPRADLAPRIEAMKLEQLALLQSLRGTSLNLKTFLQLVGTRGVSGEFPSYYSHRYLHEQSLGRDDLQRLDAENRRNMEQYMKNIHVMEELTRLQTNLRLLERHQARNVEAGKRTLDVEVTALRIGDFVLVTFPGELTVRIGLNIKAASPHEHTFVAGYTNGYIFYSPTTEQLLNVGRAQEDSDCLLAPHWQPLFEEKVADLLKRL